MLEYDNNYIRRLIQLDLVGGLSPEEKGKLENWIDESEEHRLLFYKIKKQLSVNEIRNYLQTDVEDAWKKVREKTFGAPAVRPRRVLKWLKYAAVVIPVSLSLSLWYAWKEKMENKQATVACLSPVLTLDNGEKYQLDPEEQTEIYVDEKVKAYQAGGGLIYDTTARQEENKYNRIEVPRGSEYWIVLPDGTRVWLNAATELKYPVAFHAKERRVYLKGEAYFEVTKNRHKPFTVESDAMRVRVLGTTFNFKCDKRCRIAEATLIEGEIEVKGNKDEGQIVLAPGQRAELNRNSGRLTVKQVDAKLDAVWRDNLIPFNKANIFTITKALERFYDVKIILSPDIRSDKTYSGVLKKKSTIESVLKSLQNSIPIEYKIVGNNIFISSDKK